MRNLSTLAFRNLWMRRTRTVLTAMGIVVGVAIAVSMVVANENTMQALVNLFAGMSSRAHVVVQASGSTVNTFNSRVLRDVQSFPGVQVAVPLANQTLSAFPWKNQQIRIRLAAIDPATDGQIRIYKLFSGTFLDPQSHSYEIVLVRAMTEKYKIALGDELDIAVPDNIATFKVIGILENEGPALSDFGQVGFINLSVAREVLDLGNQIGQIDVMATPDIAGSPAALEKFKNDLQAYLGSEYVVAYPSATGQELVNAMYSFRMGLGMFAAIALFMGSLLIYNTFAMNALERVHEHGLMRAIGCSWWQILRLNLSEALFLGILASLGGVGVGLLLSFPLTYYMGHSLIGWFRTEDFILPPIALVIGPCIGIIVTLIAALRPAWLASRVSPVEAMRVRGVEQEGFLMRHSWQLGLACWAILVLDFMINFLSPPVFGVIALGGTILLIPMTVSLLERFFRRLLGLVYGPPGQLGSRNLQRNKGRVTLAAGALAIGVILVISIGAMTVSLRKTLDDWTTTALGGDFYVASRYNLMRQTIGRDIAQTEGVEAVTPMMILSVKALGASNAAGFRPHTQQISLRVIDPATYRSVSSLRFAEDEDQAEQIYARFAQGGTVLITPNLKQAFGLQRGDKLRIRTTRGESDFEVAGIVVDMYLSGQVAIFSRNDLLDYFGETRSLYFAVKVAPGVSPADVEARLEGLAKRQHLVFQPTQDFRKQMYRQYDSLMMIMNAVVGMILVMSALGVMNTISMSVIERVKEFGMLRSLGMLSTQVMMMVLGEAASIGLIGAAFGLVAGVAVSFIMIAGMDQVAGWKMDYVFPIGYVALGLVLSWIVSQVAALYSAWRAMRLDAVEAMRQE